MEPEKVVTNERLDELFTSFDLGNGDGVWLVGGCDGLQIRFLLDHYPGIFVCVYEPQPDYVKILGDKYKREPVSVHPYALGDKTEKRLFGLRDTEATMHWQHLAEAGLLPENPELMNLPVTDVYEELIARGGVISTPLTMLMMNCEGAEYEIIKRLHQIHMLVHIPQVLIQFHSRLLGFEKCQEAYDLLAETHDVRWRYGDWAWIYAESKLGYEWERK